MLSQGEWPQVSCPSAETSCIGSPGRHGQYSVAAHSLVAAATSGVRTTAVAFFPLLQALALALAVASLPPSTLGS